MCFFRFFSTSWGFLPPRCGPGEVLKRLSKKKHSQNQRIVKIDSKTRKQLFSELFVRVFSKRFFKKRCEARWLASSLPWQAGLCRKQNETQSCSLNLALTHAAMRNQCSILFNHEVSYVISHNISWYLIMSHILSTLRCCSLILSICQLLTWSSHGRNAPASLSAILSMHWASRGSWVDLLTSFDCTVRWENHDLSGKKMMESKLSDLKILHLLCGQTLFFLLSCSAIGGPAWGFSLAVSTMPQWTMTCKIQGKSTKTHYYRCVIDV